MCISGFTASLQFSVMVFTVELTVFVICIFLFILKNTYIERLSFIAWIQVWALRYNSDFGANEAPLCSTDGCSGES